MAVRIRLTRVGRKHLPFYRIAVFDGRTRRDGAYIENLGTYNPREEKAGDKLKIKMDRFEHWVSKGAKPTEALHRLLKHTGAIKKS